MNRPRLYEKSVSTLVQAYYDDELKHGDCKYCAVGNLLKKRAKRLGLPVSAWSYKFITVSDIEAGIYNKQLIAKPGQIIDKVPSTRDDMFYELGYVDVAVRFPITAIANKVRESMAMRLIIFSGYSLHELAKIEYAFETADKGGSAEDFMFNGLMAVVDALDEIHQNTDAQVTQTQKKRFVLQP